MNSGLILLVFSYMTLLLNTESFPVRSCDDILKTTNSSIDDITPPSVIDVNRCSENNGSRERGGVDCGIDVSLCDNECPVLGREMDSSGCITSCECRTTGLFEGDIRFNEDNRNAILQVYQKGNATDKGTSVGERKWQQYVVNGRYQIPYVTSLNMISSGISALNTAIERFSQHTCMDLIPRTTEANYIQFIKGSGCWSYVGRQNGLQQISIGSGCEFPGTVQHEIMHALGIWHEQSRPDRDTYITILTENVQSNKLHNFELRSIDSLGSPYDTNSVMHYSGYSFSKNGNPTIIDIATGNAVVANRINFSVEDINQLNLFYECTATTAAPETTAAATTPDVTTAAAGQWSIWGAWSTCTLTCVSGTQARTRTCTGGVAGSGGCPGVDTESQSCNIANCPALTVFSHNVATLGWFCKGLLIPGDYNGDGMGDLACYNNRNQKLKLSYGTAAGTFPRVNWSGAVRFCNGFSKPAPVISGDFNGDGADDLMCRDIATGEIRTSFSKLNGFRKLVDWSDVYPNFCAEKKTTVFASDINGDGLDDLVCRKNGAILVSINEFNG